MLFFWHAIPIPVDLFNNFSILVNYTLINFLHGIFICKFLINPWQYEHGVCNNVNSDREEGAGGPDSSSDITTMASAGAGVQQVRSGQDTGVQCSECGRRFHRPEDRP